MSEQVNLEAITVLKEKYESIMVTIGISLGMGLMLSFFMYAQFIDRMPPIFIQVWLLVVGLMIAALCYIKRLSFKWLMTRHGKRAEFQPLLARIDATDIEKEAKVLLAEKFPS
ncbi:hypothetical protein MNBD_GAMMA17-664 [hydrothermal vent metagenome]|uniref:Uncharacterized protein n=1 Tax=hydrothermal vent metagenome TaxID=652676 RepID=A0A3B0ZEZ7_9ZZZZ